MNITNFTLIQTIKALEEKLFSEGELNSAYLERIEKLNPKLNAYLTVIDKGNTSTRMHQISEEEIASSSASGRTPRNDGIPVAIKDIISTKGIKTTAASKILENYIPPYNATVINKLLEKNVSILGKTNLDEFAMGSSGENSAFGVTRNPWDLDKVPGGSSSGSAVAVAADMCVFSLGTDTGGSIRQPASLCGVVGLKPSYGRVSRYGAMAMASSLDQIGPFTKSVEDASLILSWISGADGYDSNCISEKFKVQNSKLNEGIKDLKIGIPKEYFGKGLDAGVEKVVKDAISKLDELGAEIVEVSLPNTEYAVVVYYIIMASEVSSNLARFSGIRYGGERELFGEEVKRRIMLGTFSLSSGYYDAYFTKAAKVRNLIKQDFAKAFEKCDVIVGPVSPTTAWNIGEKVADPLAMYLSDAYTIPASLAGLPGLSVPCGFVDGLPVGLQILAPYMDEETIFKVGYAYEQATDWHLKRPSLGGSTGLGGGR